jgi:GNAT superfamily N-acetyltransferase
VDAQSTDRIDRVQQYLRWNAHQRLQHVPVPPFTLFFGAGPTSPACAAIPESPTGAFGPGVAALRGAFVARSARPRVEFLAAFAPDLPACLRTAGFEETARDQVMVCTSQSYLPAPVVPGLSLTVTTARTPIAVVQGGLDAHKRLWDPAYAGHTSGAAAEDFRRRLGNGRGVVAWLDGKPVGDGLMQAPHGGVTELVGIVTALAYRRRGIATAVTARLVEEALGQGAALPFLVAANAAAERVYQRVGFQPCTAKLRYEFG